MIIIVTAMMSTINTATTPPMMVTVLSELTGATVLVPPLPAGLTGAEMHENT